MTVDQRTIEGRFGAKFISGQEFGNWGVVLEDWKRRMERSTNRPRRLCTGVVFVYRNDNGTDPDDTSFTTAKKCTQLGV